MNEHSLDQLTKRLGPNANGSILEKAMQDNMEKAKGAMERVTRFQRVMIWVMAPSVLSIIAFGIALALPLSNAGLLASCAG